MRFYWLLFEWRRIYMCKHVAMILATRSSSLIHEIAESEITFGGWTLASEKLRHRHGKFNFLKPIFNTWMTVFNFSCCSKLLLHTLHWMSIARLLSSRVFTKKKRNKGASRSIEAIITLFWSLSIIKESTLFFTIALRLVAAEIH